MKTALAVILAAVAGFAAASVFVSQREAARHAARLAEQQAAWQAEKAELEAALEAVQARVHRVGVPAAAIEPVAPAKLSPAQIIAKLQELRLSPGSPARNLRQSLYWFEVLIQAGPAALPAIREFLARNEDLDLDTSSFTGKRSRDRLPADFVLPPSLRFGLFDVVRQIGGADAEKLLAEVLASAGRGVEVAWLARTLQDMAPNKYRDLALTVARNLLAGPLAIASASPLDRNHRDYLFDVLAFYNDASYASTAQAQLVRPDSQLDLGALKYLQQALGAQAVPIVAQAYNDSRLTNGAAKEPLARLALSYVGADAQANEFYQKAINDPLLTKSHRQNLIEDLNEDGFPDPKKLTPADLTLIQNRIALIEQLAPTAMDPVNAAAFKEAYKDLVKMREQVIRPPNPGAP